MRNAVIVLFILVSLGTTLVMGQQRVTSGKFSDWMLGIPDNSKVRVATQEMYIERELARVAQQPVMRSNSSYDTPEVRISVVPEQGFERGKAYRIKYHNLKDGTFSAQTPGNVEIVRVLNSGIDTYDQKGLLLFEAILANQPLIGLTIRNSGGAYPSLQVWIGENKKPVSSQIRMAFPMERIIQMRLGDIILASERQFDWNSILDRAPQLMFEAVMAMADQIKPLLARLPDAEDGAMDENGQLVRISGAPLNGLSGFNCSGFAKWIVDGLYKKLVGTYLPVPTAEDLDEMFAGYRGSEARREADAQRDSFFGLDWTRWLAVSLEQKRLGRSLPSLEQQDAPDLVSFDQVEDKGFLVTDLEAALYLLTIQFPGNFWLASINGEWPKPVGATAPAKQPLWQHYHVVVIFPYFDKDGAFKTRVFERNVESSLDSLLSRYPKERIHLTSVRASKDFQAPPLP